MSQIFPIPGALQDLEGDPYNLLPYPRDFDNGDDEAARADAFDNLVNRIIEGNHFLENEGLSVFKEDNDDEDLWMDRNRIQDLYTLVR